MCHVLLSLKPGELEPEGPYDRNGKCVLSPRQTDSQVAKSRKFPAYTVDLCRLALGDQTTIRM